jgi:phospholipid/cholesterol/gamma-HCH transport system substrate-binding protein
MQKLPPTRARLALMLLFAFSCFAIALYIWKAFGGPSPLAAQTYRLSVDFTNAVQLADSAEVRISGVPVGHVVGVGHDGRYTKATLAIDARYAPIPRDTRAILRQKTLLGETFVELTPGDRRSGKLPDRSQLPQAQVAHTTQIDDITRTLDAPTRHDLQVMLGTFAQAVGSRGATVNDTFGNFEPTAGDSSQLLGILDSEHTAVRQLVHDSGVVFDALGRRQGELSGMIRSGDSVLSTTAARNRDLADTVRILPTTLAELRPTLSEVETVARDAAPVLAALRPPARLLGPTLLDAQALAPDLRGLFGDVDRLTAVSRTALPALTSVVDAAHPVFRVLVPTLRELLPVVDYLGLYKHEVTAQISLVAAATQASLSPGGGLPPLHYLRALAPLTAESAVVQGKRLGSNRHNPYLAPLGLLKLPQGLEAFDCSNTGNPGNEPAPQCKVQQPLLFEGKRLAFPHVDLAP